MAYRYPAPTPSGYRYSRRRWPKWYKIDRVQPGELLGSLQAEHVRCGKENCRCSSGKADELHGPYWYRYWRDDDGRQRKTYVRRSELDRVRAAIEKREARLRRERDERKRHMRRGEYSWKAQNPEAARHSASPMLYRVLKNLDVLGQLRGSIRTAERP